MITLSHVTKTFGRFTAIRDASLTIARGESVALWGENGAGKSTIIRCVLGLYRHRGTITIDGLDTRRHGKAARRLVGYVPQELGFYDDLRVGEAVRYFARLKGAAPDAAGDPLAAVGLEGHERKRVRELSGGMKQRLALAIALLGDPPVLVLDEVTASLDAKGRDELVGTLSALARAGKTILFASHRPEEIQALATRVVVLDRGTIAGESPTAEFLRSLALPAAPTHARVMRLHVFGEAAARAVVALRDGGFDAHLNGVGVLVPVANDRKAAPIRLLSEASIGVDNFDLVGEAPARTPVAVPTPPAAPTPTITPPTSEAHP